MVMALPNFDEVQSEQNSRDILMIYMVAETSRRALLVC